MAEFFNMPKLGLLMSAGTVTKWIAAEGEAVAESETLFEIEAGKMSGSAQADHPMVLLKILKQAGEKAACGTPVAICGEAGEDISELEAAYQDMLVKEAEAAGARVKLGIIGGGPGGYVAAIRGAQLGAEVTLIEQARLGGTCLNEGCIPTKALLHCASLFYQAKHGENEGVLCSPVMDIKKAVQYKDAVSQRLVEGVSALMRANDITVVTGKASFVDAHTLHIDGPEGVKELTFDKIIIATGSASVAAPIPGFELPCCINSKQALSLETLPESMTIVGGGVIGLEMATVYADMGTRVTVVEMFPSLLGTADQELVSMAKSGLEQRGIVFCLGAKVLKVEQPEKNAVVTIETAEGIQEIESELVLVCTGRRANTRGLALENAGVRCDGARILTDASMRTNVQDIYAIGDCTSTIMLAHVASAQAETAAENAMGKNRTFSAKTAPSCVYMDPELASVGMTEVQAKEQGVACIVGRFNLSANGKSIMENGGYGMVKIVAEATFQRVLGVQILGPHAAELIMEGALAIKMGAKAQDLIDTIHAHPSVGESIHEAALAIQGRTIHA